mmetsp:Transcript_3818/g.15421  ORF Transcript_3818/g.15421 Transcript_3818/m.15421 type:complete len:208 (-) Transcript_3818:851-1474(-)
MLGEEVPDVHKRVGGCRAVLGGLAAHGERYDEEHGAVFGLPIGGWIGRVLAQHGRHILAEERGHLRLEVHAQPLHELACYASSCVAVAAFTVTPHVVEPIHLEELLVLLADLQTWQHHALADLLEGSWVAEEAVVHGFAHCREELNSGNGQPVLRHAVGNRHEKVPCRCYEGLQVVFEFLLVLVYKEVDSLAHARLEGVYACFLLGV